MTYETRSTLLRRVWNSHNGADGNLVRIFPAQARRRRGKRRINIQRARRRIPHDRTGGGKSGSNPARARRLSTGRRRTPGSAPSEKTGGELQSGDMIPCRHRVTER